MKHKYTLFFLTLSLFLTGSARAHEPGQFIVRAGISHVAPIENSDPVLLNGNIFSLGGSHSDLGVDNSTELGFTLNYMLSRDFSVELLAATPFRHAVTGTGGLEGIDIADVRQLPPTLSLIYHLPLSGTVQPYVGVGINYTAFFKEDLTGKANATFSALRLTDGKVSLDSSVGASMQAGVDYHLQGNMLFNLSVRWIDINTEAKIDFSNGSRLNADVEIDPFVYTLALGWVF